MWKKEKLLVTSNFSFFHIFFKRLVLLTRNKPGLVWERVIYDAIGIWSRTAKGKLIDRMVFKAFPNINSVNPRINDSPWDRIYSFLTAVHCFGDVYLENKPVAWK